MVCHTVWKNMAQGLINDKTPALGFGFCILSREGRVFTRWETMTKSYYSTFNDWFLPEASFGLRVLSLPACVCVYVCVSVNHEFVRAITHQPFKLTPKSKFTPFWACACHNSPPIVVTISKFGTKMHLSTVQIPTNFGLDWNWSSIQFLISNPDQIELFMYIFGIL